MGIRLRRIIVVLASLIGFAAIILAAAPPKTQVEYQTPTNNGSVSGSAAEALQKLVVKGRAPKTGYERSEFGSGWATTSGCDTRNIILHRDMPDSVVDEKCSVVSGTLRDPYTATTINFTKGSSDVQIDHVVALSNAWQTGAQSLSKADRIKLANDPLELLAVQGDANQQKSDGDAATWLPSNKAFRCNYVARQVAVKQKYMLWVTPAEKDAMAEILKTCPSVQIP